MNTEDIRHNELSRRISCIINLRWIAVIGVISAINISQLILKIDLPYSSLYLLSGFLTTTNIIYFAINNYIDNHEIKSEKYLFATWFANIQVFNDLFILSLLLYFSGGITNPFSFYFVFHIISASLLLSRLSAYLQGTIAMAFFSLLIYLSNVGIIPYYSLPGFGPDPGDPAYTITISARLIGLLSTVYLLIFFATSISQQIIKQEEKIHQANKELIEASENRSKFILQVTHELRAPVAAIKNYLNVALEGYMGPIEDKLKDMLKNINNRASNMLLMINELLDLASLKSEQKAKIYKQQISALNFINEQISFFHNEIAEKKIDIKCSASSELKIYGDLEQMKILFVNLIGNAIKYSNKGGEISIYLSSESNMDIIKISDNGIGISENDINNIFNEFYRAQNAVDKERTGTGLGLAISNNIIKDHHGSIKVESKEGKGTTFIIELPKDN